jgi:DNA-directed RNA polymerase sigma subunit (sigma70/sigma32)
LNHVRYCSFHILKIRIKYKYVKCIYGISIELIGRKIGFGIFVIIVQYNELIIKELICMRQLKISKSITNRESASLDKYLQEIGREELIGVEEEVELAQAIKRGDKTALQRLTKANLRFVVSVAKQYQNQGLSLPDLINEGNIGLIKVAEKFDETRGFKFISYAVCGYVNQSFGL